MARPKNTRICAAQGCTLITNGCNVSHCGVHYKRLRRYGRLGTKNESHGMYNSREYKSWKYMKGRCFNKHNMSFPNYGGRGITVCGGLVKSFNHFLSIVGSRPSALHSLDREDVNGHYSCGVCSDCSNNGWSLNIQWSDKYAQALNKRISPRNTSGHTGVSWDSARAKWLGYVTRKGGTILRKRFDSKHDAINAVLGIQKVLDREQ